MKRLKNLTMCLALTAIMSSCYVSTYVVGQGAQTSSSEVTAKNNYFLGGLVTGKQVKTETLAEGAKDYTIVSKFTFIDMLLNSLTFGIYSPRTVVVKK